MKPVTCIKHDDCVRACVASILELEATDVPHFYEHWTEQSGDEISRVMQEWFAARGMIAALIGLPGDWSFDRVMTYTQEIYPDKHFMLWCDSGGDHAVVGCNGQIVHNPAWYEVAIDGPHSVGFWMLWIVATL